MASIKDVAREAGVSTATVSRMMANKGYISESARAKVEAAVKKLGYRPNRAAQQLRDQRSRILALIVSDIQNPFFGEICRAVEAYARKQGLCVFVCNTDENAETEQHYLEVMAQEQVAGIIISPSSRSQKNAQALNKLGLPVVMIDRQSDSHFDAILVDNTDAAYRLTKRVIEGGYQRIAGLFGADSFTARERLIGFEKALSEAGLSASQIQHIPAFEAQGRTAMTSLLQSDNPPDAVICSSALIATGAYRAIHDSGRSIPEEIGFATFDDPPWANFVSPGLTVIRQPAKLIGEAAAEFLIKRIEEPQRTPSILRLHGELIERGSLR